MTSSVYRGYSYWIRRTGIGVLTAYVDIDQNAVLSRLLVGSDLSAADELLSVHGGITFCQVIDCKFADGFVLPYGHLCIGWDYGHADDIDFGSWVAYREKPEESRLCWSKVSEDKVLSDIKEVIDQICQLYDK